MPPKFQKGDLVQLRSGGPQMTVELAPGELDEFGDRQVAYRCVWFKANAAKRDEFLEHVLMAADAA